jgi:hypothetical protein
MGKRPSKTPQNKDSPARTTSWSNSKFAGFSGVFAEAQADKQTR